MGIVDKVMGGLREKEQRDALHTENASRKETGPEALALGKPSETTVDDKIGGTHTRNVLDAVMHENVQQHAHHEVTPIVNRTKEETEIHQKVQPVTDQQEHHTHHQHVAPHVARNVQEDITEDHATKYRSQGGHTHQQTVGDQTHSTSVNAPVVREHVNRHIIEEIQPIIQRQTQKVEHHHTTQQINESHVKAPTVHTSITNAPITMAEFAGKVGDVAKGAIGGHSHGHNHGTTSDGYGSTTGTGAGTGTGIGSGNHHLGSNTTGSGITGNNTTGTHATGTGSGLTGERIKAEVTGQPGGDPTRTDGYNTGDRTSGSLTGDRSTGTHAGQTGDRNIGLTSSGNRV